MAFVGTAGTAVGRLEWVAVIAVAFSSSAAEGKVIEKVKLGYVSIRFRVNNK